MLRYSAIFYDIVLRERNVVRQLIDRSTLHWRSLVTWRGLNSHNNGGVHASALPVGLSIKAARGWADNAPSGCHGESTRVVSEMPMDPI
jgi:hypothetical protein